MIARLRALLVQRKLSPVFVCVVDEQMHQVGDSGEPPADYMLWQRSGTVKIIETTRYQPNEFLAVHRFRVL